MNRSAHCYYQTHPELRVCGLLTLISCYQSHLGPWWAPQAPAGINPECSDGCRASGNTGLTQPNDQDAPKESAETSALRPAAVFKSTCPQPSRPGTRAPVTSAWGSTLGTWPSQPCTPATPDSGAHLGRGFLAGDNLLRPLSPLWASLCGLRP